MMASAGAVLSGIMWLQQLHDHRWVAPVPYGPDPAQTPSSTALQPTTQQPCIIGAPVTRNPAPSPGPGPGQAPARRPAPAATRWFVAQTTRAQGQPCAPPPPGCAAARGPVAPHR